MRKAIQKKSGFTLIELMIVVAILGILAAIAIPAFVTYVRRSKTAEATEQLKALFNGATTYYSQERAGSGLTATHQVACVVSSSAGQIAAPKGEKQRPLDDQVKAGTTFYALGFRPENAYYMYTVESTPAASACGTAAGTSATAPAQKYFMRANGDLDGDSSFSTFELAVGANTDNELFHGTGVYIMYETE